jgi:hypothetical protein
MILQMSLYYEIIDHSGPECEVSVFHDNVIQTAADEAGMSYGEYWEHDGSTTVPQLSFRDRDSASLSWIGNMPCSSVCLTETT